MWCELRVRGTSARDSDARSRATRRRSAHGNLEQAVFVCAVGCAARFVGPQAQLLAHRSRRIFERSLEPGRKHVAEAAAAAAARVIDKGRVVDTNPRAPGVEIDILGF